MSVLLLADELFSTHLNILLSFWGFSSFINFIAMIFWMRKFVLKYRAHVYDFESQGSYDYFFIFMLPYYSIYVVIKYAIRFKKNMGATNKEIAPMLIICALIIALTVVGLIFESLIPVYIAAFIQVGCYLNMNIVLNKHYVEPNRRISEDE